MEPSLSLGSAAYHRGAEMSWNGLQPYNNHSPTELSREHALAMAEMHLFPRQITERSQAFPRQHSGHTEDPHCPTASKHSLTSFGHTVSRTRSIDADRDGTKKAGVFLDAETMKEQVRKNLTKRKHNVKDFYKEEGIATKIATSYYFEVLTLVVIAANSIWIAIDTDYNDAEILLKAHPVFQAAEHFFCAFFFFEWLTRFVAFKRKRDCLKDGWFLFDSGLVLMMVSETWVMTLITVLTGSASADGAGNTSVLRIARLLRLTRMARMARLLRAMPELMILIKGMLAASRSVAFTLLLLLILMYVFAIAMTQLMADTPTGEKNFDTVAMSMYTLWIHGTLLDDINQLQRRLTEDSPTCTILFFLFILLASLTVMNMLIGVLCEVVSTVAAAEKEELLVNYVNDKLRDVVMMLDQNGDMQISKTEFMQILQHQEACRCLEDVGVDVIGLIDFVDAIFTDKNDLSNNGSMDLQLNFDKFMDVVLQLRGTNSATVKDVVDLRKFVRDAVYTTNLELRQVKDALQDLKGSLDSKKAVPVGFGKGLSCGHDDDVSPKKQSSHDHALIWEQLERQVEKLQSARKSADPLESLHCENGVAVPEKPHAALSAASPPPLLKCLEQLEQEDGGDQHQLHGNAHVEPGRLVDGEVAHFRSEKDGCWSSERRRTGKDLNGLAFTSANDCTSPREVLHPHLLQLQVPSEFAPPPSLLALETGAIKVQPLWEVHSDAGNRSDSNESTDTISAGTCWSCHPVGGGGSLPSSARSKRRTGASSSTRVGSSGVGGSDPPSGRSPGLPEAEQGTARPSTTSVPGQQPLGSFELQRLVVKVGKALALLLGDIEQMHKVARMSHPGKGDGSNGQKRSTRRRPSPDSNTVLSRDSGHAAAGEGYASNKSGKPHSTKVSS